MAHEQCKREIEELAGKFKRLEECFANFLEDIGNITRDHDDDVEEIDEYTGNIIEPKTPMKQPVLRWKEK